MNISQIYTPIVINMFLKSPTKLENFDPTIYRHLSDYTTEKNRVIYAQRDKVPINCFVSGGNFTVITLILYALHNIET